MAKGKATNAATIARTSANLIEFLLSYPPTYAVRGPLATAPAVGPVTHKIANAV